ncbi:MAG: GNAT family N-acetyltransferase, partial [Hyphomicrobiales bacterium]
MAAVETTVTMLEMMAEPLLQVPIPAIPKLMLMRAEHPSIAFYRFLYNTVGRDYAWVDRK